MSNSRKVFLRSIWVLVLCIAMFVGTTFAWFTDNATSSGNIIKAGELDLKMYWTDDLDGNTWYDVEDPEHNTIFDYDNWEPGYTEVRYIKLVNAGNLALNYKLALTPQNGVGKLAEVINVYFAEGKVELNTREDLKNLNTIGLLNNVVNNGVTANGTILANSQTSPIHKSGEVILTLATSMITSAGNEYQNESSGEFTITALATQAPFESDSFGTSYDSNAKYPVITTPGKASASVSPVNGKVPAGGVTLAGEGISAYVPEGVALEDGANKLTLSITPLENTASGISVVNNEILIPVDVHIDGIAENNTIPIIVDLGAVLPKYLNMGNYHLFHVEEAGLSAMSLVGSKAELTAHNQFTYNSDTGEVSVAMTSFSEVALLADTENGWQGDYDYDFVGQGTKDDPYIISKADELAGFGAIVGGMNGKEANSYAGVHFKLISDINLGDGETASNNGVAKTFYPIGYYNSTGKYHDRNSAISVEGEVVSNVSSFEGTFDGNGHKISNFYQNTWEMFGDYNDGYSGTPNYYKDAMGLFGYVNGGTIKNLTVDHFSSDGEFTPTGVIAAYAAEANFENIAITNCNPRVYNTGNGGIVGIGGNSDDTNKKELNFTNITIDNTNKISALWGSWDVACGGVMGMFRGNSEVMFTNCHVAAQIDVYNDVCGNYQYYWYRYSGMMIGSLRGKNIEKDGYTVPDTTGIKAKDCTVHFGEWNDYYYCELVANSLASYTHDHQFSRLEEISSLDEIKDGDNWIRNGNFLLSTEDTKTCYHIMNDKDGNLYEHKHDVADATNEEIFETVNGKTELKEDKQIVYLPFNQLFQGDGWGVKHIPIYDDGMNYFDGITILDRQDAKSDEKFEMVSDVANSYVTDTEVSIGELFADIAPDKNEIKGATVKVFVSPVGEDSTAGGVYTANTSDWTKGTLKFTGSGKATISITDYYYCKTKTINVTITSEPVQKFDNLFTQDFLYRIGNQNTVSVASLFKAIDNVPDENGDGRPDVYIKINQETFDVTIEKFDENTSVSGTYTANESDWTKGTIQFSGTGVVKVSIKDDNACEPTEVYLEVVDAKNVTKTESATSNNVVLLNDVDNGSFSVGSGYAFYGNGFAITLNPSNHTTKRGAGFDGYVHMTGGMLDNVKIVGPTFATANIYRLQGETGTGADDPVNYFRNALIIDSGDCVISNSYISGARTAIYVKDGGNVVLENTHVSGGAYANIEVSVADSVTFRNVITEQKETADSYGQNKKMIGIGIVIDNAETKVVLDGVRQYNWMTQAQWDGMLGSYKEQFPKLFTDNTYSALWHKNTGDTKIVNSGIIYACDVTEPNMVGTIAGYDKTNITLGGTAGIVYTMENGDNSNKLIDELNAPGYSANAHNAVLPKSEFNNKAAENYEQYEEGKDTYCYEDGGVVKIGFSKGDSKVWTPMILTITKGDKVIENYQVTFKGDDYTNKLITFKEGGTYQVVYKFTDPYNYKLNDSGQLVRYDVTYTKELNFIVNVIEDTAKNAEVRFGKDNKSAEKIQIGNTIYLSAAGVEASSLTNVGTIKFPKSEGDTSTTSFKYNSDKSWGSATINDQTFYFPIVAMGTTDSKWSHTGSWYGCFPVFEGTFTITDYADGGTGSATTYNGSTTEMPANLQALYPQTVFRYQGTSSKVPTTPSKMTKGTYNGKLCYTTQTDLSASNERGEEWNLATYTYTDNKGTNYCWYVGYYCAASANGGCVTPDTLVTLADGSQVRVDMLKGNEELLVWNHETGKLDKAPVAYIVDHEGIVDECEIIHLNFANGKTVKIIGEHVFFDATLSKYVAVDTENANALIGHIFAALSEDGTAIEKVELVSVERTVEETVIYEVVSYKHLNCFTEGLLSTSAYLDPLLNVFDVETDTMAYTLESVQEDIETYGLYTYADFEGLISKDAFELYNAQYLKIAVGKGNITWDDILDLIDIYFNVGVKPIQ